MKPEEREDQRYASGITPKIDMEEEIMLKLLNQYSPSGLKLLDIGCGTGEISFEIKKMGVNVTGIDFSSVAIEIAKNKGLDCKCVNLDEGMPYDDNSFDFAWAGDVIEHVFDPVLCFKEISRVLKPKGYLFMTIPNDLNITNRILTLIGRSYQESVIRNFGQYKHHTFFSRNLLKYMLEKNSLEKIDTVNKIKIPLTKKFFSSKFDIFSLFTHTIIIVAQAKK